MGRNEKVNNQEEVQNLKNCMGYMLENEPNHVNFLHEAKFRDFHQKIQKNILVVIVFLPGIDKSFLKVRTNKDVLVISTKYREDLRNVFQCDCPINVRIKLIEHVRSEPIIADYSEGIFRFEFNI